MAAPADEPATSPDGPATEADEPATSPEEPATEPAATEAVAHGEQAVSGTVTGTHRDTAAVDGAAQAITEVASGGKPAKRHAFLEHVWLVDVPADEGASLVVDAAATPGGDGFSFSVSADGGSWTHVLTVAAGSSGTHSATLPGGVGGTVQVRVVDGVRQAGESVLDTISIDRLAVRSGAGATTPPAEAPATTAPAIQLTATGWKEQGRHVVELRWTGATDVVVHRDGTRAAVSGSSWTDRTGATGSASYTYRVCAGTTCSADVTVTF